MRITSPLFDEGEEIPAHWCMHASGGLPRLEIDAVPSAARSLAAVLEDPESPLGTVTHWLVWNIPPQTVYLDPADLPAGATVGLDTFGRGGGLGPPPPAGRHRFRWVLLALDDTLALDSGAARPAFDRAIDGHVLERATLSALVEHPKESGDD